MERENAVVSGCIMKNKEVLVLVEDDGGNSVVSTIRIENDIEYLKV
jgi:hypothetical protein